ncbi:MAG: ATP-binding protein [Anaerolineae bacterium]|nr:ATP-binding protein [Anaerolineae bacterium]
MPSNSARTELPPRTPHPYNPDEFTDREDIAGIINSQVSQGIRQEAVTQSVITLFGMQGIGKSWILRHLFQKYKRELSRPGEREDVPTSKGILAAYADFENLLEAGAEPARIALIDALQQQLYEDLSGEQPYEPGFQAVTKAVKSAQAGYPDLPALHESFVRLVEALAGRYVPILFLDSLERLFDAPKLARWFEQEFLEPLVRTEKVIFVLAGRKKVRFRSFVVRQHLQSKHLLPFDLEDTLEQLARIRGGDAERTKPANIYAYSFGHPYATWKLASQPDRAAVIQTLEEIESALLEDAEPAEVRERIRLVSILRKFDVNTLRSLLARLENPEIEDKKDPYFLEIIENMVRSNLVFWSQSENAYVIDKPARKMMSLLLLLTDAATYRARCAVAFDIHNRWIQEHPIVVDFVVEAIYHQVAGSLTQDGQAPASVWDDIAPWLTEIFENDSWKSSHAHELHEHLKQDEEIQTLLPGEVWAKLLDLVCSFADFEP